MSGLGRRCKRVGSAVHPAGPSGSISQLTTPPAANRTQNVRPRQDSVAALAPATARGSRPVLPIERNEILKGSEVDPDGR